MNSAKTNFSKKIHSLCSRPLVIIILLVIYFFLSFSSSIEKSATFDEVLHINTGYIYWHSDRVMFMTTGVFLQRFATLPLLTKNLVYPETQDLPWWSNPWDVGYEFFYEMDNDFYFILFSSRAMVGLIGVLLGVLVYLSSRSFFGPTGAFISLCLYCFSPPILAHSHLVTDDLNIAFALLATVLALWSLLHHLTFCSFFLSILSFSILFLSKISSLSIIPMGFFMVLIRLGKNAPWKIGKQGQEWTSRKRQAFLILGLIIVHVFFVAGVLWFAYDLSPEGQKVEEFHQEQKEKLWEEALHRGGIIERGAKWIRDNNLLPEGYLYYALSALHKNKVRISFFQGEYRLKGQEGFFPYCFWVKNPLGTWGIFLLLGVTCFLKGTKRLKKEGFSFSLLASFLARVYPFTPVLVLLFIYAIFSWQSSLTIGNRHILPLYPPLFILAGAIGVFLSDVRARLYKVLVSLSLGLLIFESLFIWPHYLSFFHFLSGGPKHGYENLVDSSLDWGQDLPALKKWIEENELELEGKPIYLSYFGSSSPEFYKLPVILLPGFFDSRRKKVPYYMRDGYYCISATMLQSVASRYKGKWCQAYEDLYQEYLEKGNNAPEFEQLAFSRLCAYLRSRSPDARVAYSILVYKLSSQDIQKALLGPPAELYSEVTIPDWSPEIYLPGVSQTLPGK